jgi:hypothetical protein
MESSLSIDIRSQLRDRGEGSSSAVSNELLRIVPRREPWSTLGLVSSSSIDISKDWKRAAQQPDEGALAKSGLVGEELARVDERDDGMVNAMSHSIMPCMIVGRLSEEPSTSEGLLNGISLLFGLAGVI